MNTRTMRVVPILEWCIGEAIKHRHRRLSNVPPPDKLIEEVIIQASEDARAGHIRLAWQPSSDSPGYFRLVAQVPLEETTFDQFFNGRSGYRAQFYLSPEEGVLYNRDVLQSFKTALTTACLQCPIPAPIDLMFRSLDGPHSKIWVFDEQAAFDEAAEYALNPPRWVKNNANRGRRAPLPNHLMLDIKGAFIHPMSTDLFVHEFKLDRPCDLFEKGFT